jgi:hypothetical protein
MLPPLGAIGAIFCSAMESFRGQDSAIASLRFKTETQNAKKIFAYFAADQDVSCLLLRQFEVLCLSRTVKRWTLLAHLIANARIIFG